MSVEIKIPTINGITLHTKNKYVNDNIFVSLDDSLIPSGMLEIIENGNYDVTNYANVQVNVPIPEGYLKPEGTLSIVENGEYSVIPFESVLVDVPIPEGYLKPEGTLEVSIEGTYDVTPYASVKFEVETEEVAATPTEEIQTFIPSENKYINKVVVNPIPSEYLIPSGTLDITENGEHDVATYEKVNVNVESTSKFPQMVARTITELTEEDMKDVTSIGAYSFFRATTLQSIFIPEGVKTFGESAFGYCSALHTMYIPSTINMSRHNVFQYASLKLQNIYYSGTIYQWCNIAFSNEYSTPVYWAKKLYVKNTNGYELLTNLVIPANVITVGAYTFAYNEALTSVTFEAGSTKTLSAFAFYKCYGLTSVTLKEGLTTLNRYAFSQCTALTEITIPSSVTKIEGESLSIGTSTNKATIKMLATTPPTLGSGGIDSATIEKIEIPSGSLSAYSAATNWSALTSLFVEV